MIQKIANKMNVLISNSAPNPNFLILYTDLKITDNDWCLNPVIHSALIINSERKGFLLKKLGTVGLVIGSKICEIPGIHEIYIRPNYLGILKDGEKYNWESLIPAIVGVFQQEFPMEAVTTEMISDDRAREIEKTMPSSNEA